VQVTPGTQGGAAATQEDHRAVELVSEDEAREAAHGEEQMQTQRNIDSAQGGTVDCTETTEPKKKRQRKNAEAGPMGPAPDDDSTQGGAAVTRAAPAAAAAAAAVAATAAGTDSAQGGTVDCAATTELTCSGTDSAQRGTTVTRNLTGTGGSKVTYPAQEARDEDQLQPQRNIDSAQGGTVDCAETTEPKKKRKRKRVGGDKQRKKREDKKKRSQPK
jgi:hypothetical protein